MVKCSNPTFTSRVIVSWYMWMFLLLTQIETSGQISVLRLSNLSSLDHNSKISCTAENIVGEKESSLLLDILCTSDLWQAARIQRRLLCIFVREVQKQRLEYLMFKSVFLHASLLLKCSLALSCFLSCTFANKLCFLYDTQFLPKSLNWATQSQTITGASPSVCQVRQTSTRR